jgi:hypothetical protein
MIKAEGVNVGLGDEASAKDRAFHCPLEEGVQAQTSAELQGHHVLEVELI